MLWTILIIVILTAIILFGPLIIQSNNLIPPSITTIEIGTWATVLKSFVETVAIIVAGLWTYDRFIQSREKYPYPKIQHRIEHYALKEGIIYLGVFVTVINEGKRKLNLASGRIIARQVSPLPEKIAKRIKELDNKNKTLEIRSGTDQDLFIDSSQRLRLDTLGERTWKKLPAIMQILEPGQTRETEFVFLIDKDVDVIEVISFFEYKRGKPGWEFTTLHSLRS